MTSLTNDLPERWVQVPFEVSAIYEGLRLDQFLAKRLKSYSRTRVKDMFREHRVTLAGKPCRASRRVKRGEHVCIAYLRQAEQPLPESANLPVVYEDADLLVINKPGDLLSHPTDKIVDHTVTGILRHFRPDLPNLHLLHRLDRETSGVLALAKNTRAAQLWTRAMERHQIQKTYIALVRGTPPKRGVLEWPLGPEGGDLMVRQSIASDSGVPAVTHFRTLEQWPNGLAIVEAQPRTGRLHQIRVHFAAAGFPILGDLLYHGNADAYRKLLVKQLKPEDRQRLGFARLALHALKLEFDHPTTGVTCRIEAPLPADMKLFISRTSQA